jgi:hypothetical protein
MSQEGEDATHLPLLSSFYGNIASELTVRHARQLHLVDLHRP